MYNYIKGPLVHKGDNYIVVEANGIGYHIYTSLNTLFSIGDIPKNVTVYIYLYLKEGIMELYGFNTSEEKDMFINLISVSGVGPKAAMAILSVAAPSQLAAAIVTNNAALIQKGQGIGKKTAQRVILELKDKIKKSTNLSEYDDEAMNLNEEQHVFISEAIQALVVLGYSEKEAQAALKDADTSMELEELIKLALKRMI